MGGGWVTLLLLCCVAYMRAMLAFLNAAAGKRGGQLSNLLQAVRSRGGGISPTPTLPMTGQPSHTYNFRARSPIPSPTKLALAQARCRSCSLQRGCSWWVVKDSSRILMTTGSALPPAWSIDGWVGETLPSPCCHKTDRTHVFKSLIQCKVLEYFIFYWCVSQNVPYFPQRPRGLWTWWGYGDWHRCRVWKPKVKCYRNSGLHVSILWLCLCFSLFTNFIKFYMYVYAWQDQ